MLRLLPKDPQLSWTPYAWLVYAALFLAMSLAQPELAPRRPVSVGAVVVFLALYFYGYWVKGWKLLLVTAALFVLGAGLAPWNPLASVFIVYAAAFAGKMEPPRQAMVVLAVIVALVGIESWALRLSPWFWSTAILFALVVGGVNTHFAAIGRAAERLRLSQEQVQQLVRIAERERIARDLHDLLGHTLSTIALKAELAGKLLPISPQRAAAEIRDVERVSRDALREVRGAVAGYRSEGLPAELARARLALEGAGVRPEYFTLPVVLPPAAEAALALAVREAVTNVIRHAGAASCRITLDRGAGGTVLEVADDGRGGARETGTGTGLRAMRERLSALGATVEILPAERRDALSAGAAEAAEGAAAPGAPAGLGERGTRLIIRVPDAAGAAPVGGVAARDGRPSLAPAASGLAAEPGR
jgi:two-component system sensor histidine kinase DesK